MTHIGDLHSDKRNPRKHGERNIRAIVKSLEECGAARSIVIDEHGNILAGNGLVEAASIAGIENVQIVEADGSTIIAVRRSNLTEKQKKRLAVLDNRTSELAEWDGDVLRDLVREKIDLSDIWHEDELSALIGLDVEETTLPDMTRNENHIITLRFVDEDEEALKWFIEQFDDNQIMPVQAGSKIVERIKKLFADKTDL